MFNLLSSIQRQIVFEKSGIFVVRACPGSGKTFTVAAKLANMLTGWQDQYRGIATLSFTNVAWKEIENKLDKKFNIKTPLTSPHFLGTLDSFLNRFVFLPFGHKILGTTERPKLIGEPHGTWSGGRYIMDYAQYFDNISFDINDNLIAFDESRFNFKN